MKFEIWLFRSPLPVAVLATILSVAGAQWRSPVAQGPAGVVTIEELQPPVQIPVTVADLGEMQVAG